MPPRKPHGRRRLRAVAAGTVRPGDRLWSSATMRELVVIAATRVRVKADGNLYDEGELEPADAIADAADQATAVAIVLRVLGPGGDFQTLGAYAPHARLQVLR